MQSTLRNLFCRAMLLRGRPERRTPFRETKHRELENHAAAAAVDAGGGAVDVENLLAVGRRQPEANRRWLLRLRWKRQRLRQLRWGLHPIKPWSLHLIYGQWTTQYPYLQCLLVPPMYKRKHRSRKIND